MQDFSGSGEFRGFLTLSGSFLKFVQIQGENISLYRGGGPRELRLQNLETKKKIDVFRYIFRDKFELKHIISRLLSINKLYLFQINDD